MKHKEFISGKLKMQTYTFKTNIVTSIQNNVQVCIVAHRILWPCFSASVMNEYRENFHFYHFQVEICGLGSQKIPMGLPLDQYTSHLHLNKKIEDRISSIQDISK